MKNTDSGGQMVVLKTTSSVVMVPDAWRDRLVIQQDPVTGAVESWRIEWGNRFSITGSKLVDRGDRGAKVYTWRGNRWRRLSSRAARAVLKSVG